MDRKPIYLLLSILIWTVGLFAQVDPGTQNLKHSWTFDDGTANDYIGGAHGFLMGGAVVDGGALVTAELSQYLDILAEDVALQTYQEFTVEITFQADSGLNTNYYMFFYFGDTQNDMGTNGYFLTPARGDNVSRAAISCWVETAYQGETGANGPECDDGVLHHMVGTLNSEEIALFVDGVEASRTTLAERNTIDALIPNHCYLAKSGYNGDATWRGKIFKCNIYDRVLSNDEILFLAQEEGITAVEENIAVLPKGYDLLQNYPNPFNPGTTITFNVEKRSRITITLYDVQGRQVSELLNEVKESGQSSVQFDGSNLPSGLYLCRMQNDGGQILTKKMMLLK